MRKLLFSITALAAAISCASGLTGLALTMPRETELPGWSYARHPRTVGGADIESIDTEYRRCGAVEYADAVYMSVSEPDRELTVHLVKFDTTLNAYGRFSLDRGFVNDAESSNVKSRLTENSMSVLSGKHLLIIKSNRSEVPETFNQLAGLILNKLPPSQDEYDALPDYINAVPGNINNGDLIYYPARGGLMPEVKNYFARRIKYGRSERTIIFCRTDSRQTALDEYFSQIIRKGNFIVIRTRPDNAAYRKDNGIITLVTVHKKWFLGIINDDTLKGTETVLKNTLRSVDEFDAASR